MTTVIMYPAESKYVSLFDDDISNLKKIYPDAICVYYDAKSAKINNDNCEYYGVGINTKTALEFVKNFCENNIDVSIHLFTPDISDTKEEIAITEYISSDNLKALYYYTKKYCYVEWENDSCPSWKIHNKIKIISLDK